MNIVFNFNEQEFKTIDKLLNMHGITEYAYGGSLSLMMLGLIKYRELHDIDIFTRQYPKGNVVGESEERTGGFDGWSFKQVKCIGGIDLFVFNTPIPVTDIVCAGTPIRVIHPVHTLQGQQNSYGFKVGELKEAYNNLPWINLNEQYYI